MIKELKNKLDFEINSIQFVKRDGLNFLDIELPETDLKIIEEKSKIISSVLDEMDLIKEPYYLNVFSQGTEKEIELKNINLFLNQYLYFQLSKHYFNKMIWEGLLLENINDYVVIQINNKGKIQKLKIFKSDIQYLKTTAKVRKG